MPPWNTLEENERAELRDILKQLSDHDFWTDSFAVFMAYGLPDAKRVDVCWRTWYEVLVERLDSDSRGGMLVALSDMVREQRAEPFSLRLFALTPKEQ